MKAPAIFISTILLFFACSVQAQFTFGIKGSYTRTDQHIGFEYSPSIYQYANSTTTEGFGTAISIYYSLNKFFQIGTEPGMSRRGGTMHNYGAYMIFECGDFEEFSFENCDPVPIEENRINVQYLQVPVLAKFNVGLFENRFSIFAKGGVGAAWMTSAYREDSNLFIEEVPVFYSSVDLKENSILNRWEMEWQTGTGLSMKAGLGYFFMEAIFHHGLTDFYQKQTSRTRGFEYALGYQINL